ncbi:MAG: FHA domain-containing protein [Anaerolineae bacterium]|nr:FHA domain-containing protein [Anaerolineae bacterium]
MQREGETLVNSNWLGEARQAFFDGDLDEVPVAKPESSEVVLRIDGVTGPLVVEVTKMGVILGRADVDGRIFPDIDLSPYGAEQCGVSRRHARLVLNTSTYEVEIFDMGSTNGTYVNGERLVGSQNRYLNHGDKLRLGRLNLQFFYRL